MIFRIDHVGMVTDDPAGVGEFLSALQMRKVDEGLAEPYGVTCAFWQTSDDVRQPTIEVVTPARAESAVSRQLARTGPGLHHVAVEVDDVWIEMARLRERGFTPVDAEPCRGARPAMRVAFLYARRPAGLLVELVQYGPRRR